MMVQGIDFTFDTDWKVCQAWDCQKMAYAHIHRLDIAMEAYLRAMVPFPVCQHHFLVSLANS